MLNHGQLVYRNLETNVVTILKEQQNMNYMIRPELTGGGTVVYDVEDMIPVKSCTPMVDCYQKAKKTLKVGLKVALPKE